MRKSVAAFFALSLVISLPSFGLEKKTPDISFQADVFEQVTNISKSGLPKELKDNFTNPSRKNLLEHPILNKLFVKNDKVRIEYNGNSVYGKASPKRDKRPSWIEIRNSRSSWVLFPKSKTYTKSQSTQPFDNDDLHSKLNFKGTKIVNGLQCEHYERTVNINGYKVQSEIFWSSKLKYTIRSVTASSRGTVTRELRSIVVKSLPDSLFRIPKGYKQIHALNR